MPHPLFAIEAAGYRPHALHDAARNWPETNCYVDLWIEVVGALGLEPAAMFGFTVTQDFEGDQFTFFKVPVDDLEALYGLTVQELSIFDRLDGHVAEQIGRDRLVLVEVDGYFLPDTAGVSYRTQHTKTTVGITHLDREARKLRYFHNGGFFALEGEDFDGIFGAPGDVRSPTNLFPYVEFAKLPAGPVEGNLAETAKRLLARHLARRPEGNPIRAYGEALSRHLADLSTRPGEYFHAYAFNTLRQLGANFELLASHLDWLTEQGETGLGKARDAALEIASAAKVMQFKLARAMARGRFDGLDAMIEPMAVAHDTIMAELVALYGGARSASRRAA